MQEQIHSMTELLECYVYLNFLLEMKWVHIFCESYTVGHVQMFHQVCGNIVHRWN